MLGCSSLAVVISVVYTEYRYVVYSNKVLVKYLIEMSDGRIQIVENRAEYIP